MSLRWRRCVTTVRGTPSGAGAWSTSTRRRRPGAARSLPTLTPTQYIPNVAPATTRLTRREPRLATLMAPPSMGPPVVPTGAARGPGPTAAEVTRRYIEEHPAIRDCLGYDIVNFTSLARKIRAETGLVNQEAVEVALRRYQRQMRTGATLEGRVLAVVRASRLEV